MEKKSKGYWLFVYNSCRAHTGQGILDCITGAIFKIPTRLNGTKMCLHFVGERKAIYKWIEPQ